MFTKLLIANRGEIACRVIHTAKQLGMYCIAVYSEVDKHALHVELADEAHCIGPAASIDSYLNQQKIIEVAKLTGAEAIHPGYGFLSENAEFSKLCERNKLIFIGPSSDAIAAMGDKKTAKQLMQQANVPTVPGYNGQTQDETSLQQEANKIGYPVLLKAAAGGGGKGMKLVSNDEEFAAAYVSAKREAQNSFGDDTLIIEKYLVDARHIEMQILCDKHGNGVYLFERDCSLQRRHQKVIEEAPASNFNADMRKQMGETAVQAAKAINYSGAGTIEFLFDDQNQQFYFMEMNTRLQVEHGVTELITGLDLVEQQCKIAAGEKLALEQSTLTINGHAIEVRVYAEDPQNNFLPHPGIISSLILPEENPQRRIDIGIRAGDEVSRYYDPMLAKIMVHAADRSQTINKLLNTLTHSYLAGIKSNLGFLRSCLQLPEFVAGTANTQTLENKSQQLLAVQPAIQARDFAIASMFLLLTQQIQQSPSPWHQTNAWQLNLPATQTISFIANQQILAVEIIHPAMTSEQPQYIITVGTEQFNINAKLQDNCKLIYQDQHGSENLQAHKTSEHVILMFTDKQLQLQLDAPDSRYQRQEQKSGQLIAPMPGTVVAVLKHSGEAVARGERLMVMEAMKMEHTITAPDDGIIANIFFNIGDQVNEGAELISLTAATATEQ